MEETESIEKQIFVSSRQIVKLLAWSGSFSRETLAMKIELGLRIKPIAESSTMYDCYRIEDFRNSLKSRMFCFLELDKEEVIEKIISGDETVIGPATALKIFKQIAQVDMTIVPQNIPHFYFNYKMHRRFLKSDIVEYAWKMKRENKMLKLRKIVKMVLTFGLWR